MTDDTPDTPKVNLGLQATGEKLVLFMWVSLKRIKEELQEVIDRYE